ncbi:MAG: XkdX family protein [Oscillospiraceae bacterium]|nr:XkdX family protein [Oscillospiraceae bacterium]
MYEKIKYFYDKGYWQDQQVQHAVAKGVITRDQMDEIMKGGTDAEV